MVYSEYNKTVLENGLTIVSEHIPSVRSISVGVWIKAGSRFETAPQNGVAHFLEHMMFKGTEKRTPLQIARSLESVGGNLNAFTSKEVTCYYAEILDEHLERAIDVLADILCCSTFHPRELEKERQVILDEIQSLEDTPDELVQELFLEYLFPGNSLGYPILGKKETVARFKREDLLDFYRNYYFTKNVVIAAAGNVEHSRLVTLVQNYFHFSQENHPWQLESPNRFGEGEIVLERNINQAHICLGIPALPYDHPRRYELLVLNTLLGGGMSSRLFQNVREKHGVAYNIYSFLDFYFDTGLLGIYLGTERNKLKKAFKLVHREIDRLRQNGIPGRELQEVKSQLKGNLMLGLESTARRMSRLAKMEIYLGTFQEIDTIIDQIDAVTRQGVRELIELLFDEQQFLTVVLLPTQSN